MSEESQEFDMDIKKANEKNRELKEASVLIADVEKMIDNQISQ